MAAVADTEEKSEFLHKENLQVNSQRSEDKPWIEFAVQQAQILKQNLEETTDSVLESVRFRLLEIHSTSSVHLHQTLETLKTIKAEYNAYEDIFFGKVKDGLVLAASHPSIACGLTIGLGVLIMKRPRQFLFHNTLRLFRSEESLLSSADAKVKELRQSIELVKNESKKLEERAILAEEEMKRGRTKLRQTGHQIQGVIRSIHKIERQARGLKDILGELPSRAAFRFRSQVSSVASEAKRERNALGKEAAKITNYGISI